jgi:ubiquinone/menaquinone biosynthesis C-methylase UbiE
LIHLSQRDKPLADYKVQDVANECKRKSNNITVIDLGAGVGVSVPYFKRYLPAANIICLDVSTKSLAIGQKRFGDQAYFVRFDGSKLPFSDASVEIAFAACVFHHVPLDRHMGLLRELYRVLRRQGRVFVFEHNPWNPLTQYAVNTCPFDENAKLISAPRMRAKLRKAGFERTYTRYRIFFPEWLNQLRSFEPALSWLPLGAQYYVAGTK